jgi:hypothetical protein
MTRRPSLFAGDKSAPPAEKPAPQPDIRRKTPRSPTRVGKRVVTIYLDELAWRQLKMLGLDENKTTQALVEDALNMLFRSKKLNRSA